MVYNFFIFQMAHIFTRPSNVKHSVTTIVLSVLCKNEQIVQFKHLTLCHRQACFFFYLPVWVKLKKEAAYESMLRTPIKI